MSFLKSCSLMLFCPGTILCEFCGLGQTCVCANHIFIQFSIYTNFASQLAKKVTTCCSCQGRKGEGGVGLVVDRGEVFHVLGESGYVQTSAREHSQVTCSDWMDLSGVCWRLEKTRPAQMKRQCRGSLMESMHPAPPKEVEKQCAWIRCEGEPIDQEITRPVAKGLDDVGRDASKKEFGGAANAERVLWWESGAAREESFASEAVPAVCCLLGKQRKIWRVRGIWLIEIRVALLADDDIFALRFGHLGKWEMEFAISPRQTWPQRAKQVAARQQVSSGFENKARGKGAKHCASDWRMGWFCGLWGQVGDTIEDAVKSSVTNPVDIVVDMPGLDSSHVGLNCVAGEGINTQGSKGEMLISWETMVGCHENNEEETYPYIQICLIKSIRQKW
ncbi:hypothetical protein L210DRAFT_931445 [Boletus edulis BED1]|uniref:Uncharacterized protein n=1 Tax=Boletus edulis BED1 TaxID=1328754 RepID=A0AAD4BT81_BOLED|nr:hypothetical protein L210DRAFT_931445 [Boletus edulis BED1]